MAKKPRNAVAKFIPELLIFCGVCLVVISTSHKLLQIRALSISHQTISEYIDNVPLEQRAPLYPVHITIPWFVDVDIDPQTFVEGKWTISPSNASYLTDSAEPKEAGNIIIYGHNKREILGNIRALKGNEQITLTLSDGSNRVYKITKIQQVSPNKTESLSPTDNETLTLYTCSGFLDSQRFVVSATPLEI